jgi:TonB family protein
MIAGPAVLIATLFAAQPPTEADEPWPPAVALRRVDGPTWRYSQFYPAAAQASREQGRTAIRLLVGRDGVPRRCRLVMSSGFESLDQQSCALGLQQRFRAHLGSDGGPAEASYVEPITWSLGILPAPLFRTTQLAASLTVENRRVTQCTVTGSGPVFPLWSRHVCRQFDLHAGYFLASVSARARRVTIALDLTSNLARIPADVDGRGRLVASRRTEFGLHRRDGWAINCRTPVNQGFGPAEFDDLAPCSMFLHDAIYFRWPQKGRTPTSGVLRIRVYED